MTNQHNHYSHYSIRPKFVHAKVQLAMKKWFFLLLLSFPLWLAGQTQISGTVLDNSGEPIPGANVLIQGSYDGASTDTEGRFSFTAYNQGKSVLAVTYIGFQPWADTVNLTGEAIERTIKMKPVISDLDVVVISAGSFEASDARKAVVLKPLDIVTTAGANADIFGALKTLPGSNTVGEDEGLYVRGGDKNETGYYIDGLTVASPYFGSAPDIPSRGRFSPFDFKGTVFSTGGYSAQYGQALSAAIVLESQDLAPKTQSNIGLLPLAISAGHTQAWEKSSIGIQVGATDLTPFFWINPQRTEWTDAPHGYNGSLTLRHKPNDKGILKSSTTYNKGMMALELPNLEDPDNPITFGLNSSILNSSATYQQGLGKHYSLYLGASFNRDVQDIDFEGQNIRQDLQLYQGRAMFTRFLGQWSAVRLGGEVQNRVTDWSVDGLKLTPSSTYAAGFAEADILFGYRLAIRPGVRAEYDDLIGEYNVAPRLALAYKTGSHSQISVAAGQFYQTPMSENGPGTYNFYQQAGGLVHQKATHLIANVQHMEGGRTFRLEGYHKIYDQLLTYSQDSMFHYANDGHGYATGVDLFWRDQKTFKRMDYWVSYSLVFTERLFRDYPVAAQPTFVSKHNLNVVLKRYFQKLKTAASMTYTFASGRPYYNPNNPKFLADRTPVYHDISLSASYLTSIWDNFTVVFLGINNILGTDNIYSYRYSTDGSYREAVKSPGLRMIVVGVFVSFDHSKKQEE